MSVAVLDITFPEVLALATGVLGVAGLIFTALKYNRDDATAVVSQQSQIVGDMKALNDELRTTVQDLRLQRDELKLQVDRLTEQLDR